MSEQGRRKGRDAGQWPVAVSLVICALFVAAITLKTRSESEKFKAHLFDSLTKDAQIAAAQIDSTVLVAMAKINPLYAISELEIAGAPAQPAHILSIATYNPDGTLAHIGVNATQDMLPLAAAAQLASDAGWIGSIARGNGVFAPAIAKKEKDGTIIAATLKLGDVAAIPVGSNIIITDRNGTLISLPTNLQFAGSRNITEALGISVTGLEATSGASHGAYAQTSDGRKFALGISPTKAGYWAIVAQPRAISDAMWQKTLGFYLLLVLGPILAFVFIWGIANRQQRSFKDAQEQKREAERRLQIAIDGAKCGVWDWDISADTIFMTERLANDFGLGDAGRYQTNQLIDALVEPDKIKLRAAIRSALQIGSIDIVMENGKPLKHPSHIQLRGRGASTKKNPAQLRVIGVSIDVSEHMSNEARVASAERRLRDALDSMSGPFALWSNKGALVMWNNAFATNFKLDALSLRVGSLYEDVSKLARRNVVSQRTDKFDSQAQEIELTNGKWLRLVERRTSDGGLVSIGIDITPQKETEEEALRSERQLREVVTQLQKSEGEAAELAKQYEREKIKAVEASASKNSFLANMSHELRTPLNAINGFSQIMAEQIFGPLGDKRYVEYSADILASGKHLLDLINDVLDMAKIEAGKFKVFAQPMSLTESIEQAIRVVHGRAAEKNIAIERNFAASDDMIGDARAIKQIFINLLSNAIKFTEPGGRVLIRSRDEGNASVISVIDTGIGISETNLPRLGNAFEQVESEHARTNQGTGLGLALCRSFAEMHGGQMNISSKLGVGTKVDIILPHVAVIQDEEAA
ncbi:MAG: two-component system cell cycle sensor histidine kinase PleC [Hyphomonadaceae bacterium]|nr:MAG: two-component system cell cycle sensor histidine kinase PleC [Hyphomonadaceae bacterium]